jgi:hypothetical protein
MSYLCVEFRVLQRAIRLMNGIAARLAILALIHARRARPAMHRRIVAVIGSRKRKHRYASQHHLPAPSRTETSSSTIVKFENSAHMVAVEEPGRLLMHLVNDVRPWLPVILPDRSSALRTRVFSSGGGQRISASQACGRRPRQRVRLAGTVDSFCSLQSS